MSDEMTIDDAINVANILSDVLASDANDDVRELAVAARRLVRHIGEQACELERERARRQALARGHARFTDGHPLEEGADGGGRRDFLAGRPVHAGQTLCMLTCNGWQAVRIQVEHVGQRARAVSAAAWRATGRGDLPFLVKHASHGRTNCSVSRADMGTQDRIRDLAYVKHEIAANHAVEM